MERLERIGSYTSGVAYLRIARSFILIEVADLHQDPARFFWRMIERFLKPLRR
jgi:hypothetical protein